jgi:hypothetical protein
MVNLDPVYPERKPTNVEAALISGCQGVSILVCSAADDDRRLEAEPRRVGDLHPQFTVVHLGEKGRQRQLQNDKQRELETNRVSEGW